jgi:hypothetical protein
MEQVVSRDPEGGRQLAAGDPAHEGQAVPVIAVVPKRTSGMVYAVPDYSKRRLYGEYV